MKEEYTQSKQVPQVVALNDSPDSPPYTIEQVQEEKSLDWSRQQFLQLYGLVVRQTESS